MLEVDMGLMLPRCEADSLTVVMYVVKVSVESSLSKPLARSLCVMAFFPATRKKFVRDGIVSERIEGEDVRPN
jgi:hypothetical protein